MVVVVEVVVAVVVVVVLWLAGGSAVPRKEVGSESSIELAFISEAQFLSLTGCTPKALECDVHERQAEDGQSIITGVYVSYGDVVDVPMQQILSWRKVKFFARTVTSAQEAHLTPERQLRRQQAVPLMQLIESQRWRPGCIDKQGGEAPFLAKVPMLGGLMSKGQRQLEKKEEALQKKLLLARQAEEEEKEEKDDDRSADSVDASSSQVEEVKRNERMKIHDGEAQRVQRTVQDSDSDLIVLSLFSIVPV